MSLHAATALIYTAVAGAIAAIMAANAPDPHEVMHAALNIIDDSKLRLICIAGSLGGAILSVGLMPPPPAQSERAFIRRLALRISCASIAGVLFSPMLMRWLHIEPQTDAVLAVSGIVSLASWSVLPLVVAILTKMAGKKLDEQITPPKP